MVSPVQRLTVVDSYLTCTMFPASPRRAKSPTAPQRPFLTFRTLFAYCGCVDAGYVQYSSRTCATSGATEQPTSRCVPYNEARATQECAIRFEGSRKPVGGSITPITPTSPPNNSRSSIQNTQMTHLNQLQSHGGGSCSTSICTYIFTIPASHQAIFFFASSQAIPMLHLCIII